MFRVGEYLGKGRNKRKILEIIPLSNGWILVKTKNTKSEKDFKVRTITDITGPKNPKYFTPKHAHFAIDFYGKVCCDPQKAEKVFRGIIKVWQGEDVKKVIKEYENESKNLPGYKLDYILYALKWILEQEDINFQGRPERFQRMLDEKCQSVGVSVPLNRKGSQLAISLFCDILKGLHPVEALLGANLDIIPRFKRRGG